MKQMSSELHCIKEKLNALMATKEESEDKGMF